MENNKFTKRLIAVAMGCAVAPAVYAETSNPQEHIGLTEQISSQYSGNGVKLGVVDSGFMVEHPLVNREKLHSIIFELTDSKGKKHISNPNIYDIDTEKDEEGNERKIYSMHGGAVAGIIGAKEAKGNNYAGGVAKNSDIYIAQFDPNKSPDNDEESEKEEDDKSSSILLDKSAEDGRTGFATAIGKVAANKVLAINNSWNEDPVGNTAQEMDNRYKQAIARETQNTLINALKQAVANDILLVFAAGNESKEQPGVMAALPRYLPELESHYLSVIAVDKDKQLAEYSNHCGVSKNWCVAAPGDLTVIATDGAEEGKKYPGLKKDQGTSFAAPVVTGSLAVLKERFNYFTPTQIRDTLLTTATDLGEKGVDEKFGWGLINMSKAVKGPAQLLRDETYTVTKNDTWSNTLTTERTLTKRGSAALTLDAQDNRIKGINIAEGKLVLSGKTSADQVNNLSELSVADLTVNKRFQSGTNSALEALSSRPITAQGKDTVVSLAGKLAVSEQLKQNAQAGTTIADIVTLKDGAVYQGGFDQLADSPVLAGKGLRQDLYFKDNKIELKANKDQVFTDPQASTNAKSGLQALNALRNTGVALRKGIYNDWLQKAIENNDLQNFHYHIGNVVYADGLEFLRGHLAGRLNRSEHNLSRYHDIETDTVKLWLDTGDEKYKSDHISHYGRTEFKTERTGIGAAYKPDDKITLTGDIAYVKSDVTKPQSSSTIRQVESGVALRYMPQQTGWFTDLTGKFARVDYKQNRSFNGSRLASGANKGWLLGGEWRTGYGFAPDGWGIEPSIGLQAIRLHMNELKENGELATFTPAYKKTDVNLSGGLRLKKMFVAGDWRIMPDLSFNYIRRLSGGKTALQSSLAGVTVDSEATSFGKNQTEIGLGLLLEKNSWFISSGVRHSSFKNGKATGWLTKIGLTF